MGNFVLSISRCTRSPRRPD